MNEKLTDRQFNELRAILRPNDPDAERCRRQIDEAARGEGRAAAIADAEKTGRKFTVTAPVQWSNTKFDRPITPPLK